MARVELRGLEPYKRTATFTEETVPAALLGEHSTKAGVWGLIHVVSGHLRYRIVDPRREASEQLLTPQSEPGLIVPTLLHRVEPLGNVEFFVEFWRAPEPATQERILSLSDA